jgi:hypothetical protein
MALVAGCYGETSVGYSGAYDASLVEVEPGVQVVSDYDYPVFYSEGAYWRYNSGYWYRSPYYDRGFTAAVDVPVRVRGIRHPETYAHYRRGGVRHRIVTRDHRRY